MPLRILTQPGDMTEVRSLCLGMLSSDRAAQLVPDGTIQSVAVAGQAEALVRSSVGPDWAAILAGNAPTIYAGGDPTMAYDMLRAATLMFTCAYLCPLLKQIIPVQETGELVGVRRDIDWDCMQAEYQRQAKAALGYLLSVTAAPAMIMARPPVSPIDPENTSSSLPLPPPLLMPQGSTF